MADNVVKLMSRKPHISGDAQCLSCGYEWSAVADVGTVELECPKCKTWKGVFAGCTIPDTIWQCGNCGNQHFYITDYECMCSRCGITQSW